MMDVKNVKKYYRVGRHQIKAVDGVSFQVRQGEIFGLVGESGCGKSTIGRLMIGLESPAEGKVFFRGKNVRGSRLFRQLQMVFQDPSSSLNPRMRVLDTIAEGIDIQRLASGRERQKRVEELLDLVGLPRSCLHRYPHEFSGGQRQRIGIARALAVEPELLILDEPLSALDVSIQAQIVNLLKRLQKQKGLTYLMIAHDLAMIRYVSDRIGVMYLGRLVEQAPSEQLYDQPLHPYTKILLSSILVPDPHVANKRERIQLTGEPLSPFSSSTGCPFHTHCPQVKAICREEFPRWREVKKEHGVACHLYL